MLGSHGLDRRSPVPLYHQLEQILRAYMADAKLRPGDLLPTEQALTDAFGVSRSTARQALARLQQDGLVERRPARGTRVAERAFTETFAWLDSYVLNLVAEGRDVRTAELSFTTTEAPPRFVREGLGLASGEPVHVVERVMMLDGRPQNLARTYVRARLAPDFSRDDLATTGVEQSVYHVLQVRYGLAFAGTEVHVEPHALTVAQAARFGRPPGAPAIRRTRVVTTRGGEPLLLDRAVFVNGFRLVTPAPHARPHAGRTPDTGGPE